VQPWRNGRLPNSLRLKVRPDPADASKLRGIIFHVPVRPPNQFAPDLEAVNNTWQQVHQLLDELGKPGGDRSYSMISDQNRRDALSNQLRGVTIKRASS
jgi:hypothetical protein